jgi:hypothetical protein
MRTDKSKRLDGKRSLATSAPGLQGYIPHDQLNVSGEAVLNQFLERELQKLGIDPGELSHGQLNARDVRRESKVGNRCNLIQKRTNNGELVHIDNRSCSKTIVATPKTRQLEKQLCPQSLDTSRADFGHSGAGFARIHLDRKHAKTSGLPAQYGGKRERLDNRSAV